MKWLTSKIHVMVEYDPGKSCIVYRYYFAAHTACRILSMIEGKKRNFLQILDHDTSIGNHTIDSKIPMVVDYDSGKNCIVFGSDMTTQFCY